ncbi:cation:proton antiporter regulatory subunit [Natronomonas marina]|jgi:TrkA domain protein|uniref:cation:proton antiporter regulatory subunit n=1 Tax=Natronomonas marina TaxID=2961939 RepID=UPI0020C9F10F|nr:TrkA C-terminal domain-containing protein [Natronomonas marina]
MTVYESDLPGVGKKFEVEIDDGERLVVVTHNTGKREVFRRRGDDDAEKLFELSDRLARQVGTILEGAYFQPVVTESTETMLGEDTLFEWVAVVEGSELVGRTLADLDFREATGASVVAVQRDGETEANPGADTTVRAGDTLIVVGSRADCDRVERLAAGATDPHETAAEAAESPESDDEDA